MSYTVHCNADTKKCLFNNLLKLRSNSVISQAISYVSRGRIVHIALLMSLILCLVSSSFGQDPPSQSQNTKQGNEKEALLAQAKTYLNENKDSALTIIFRIVPEHCGSDFICQYDLYQSILTEIELSNAYWRGVPLAEEMVRLAKENGDPEKQGKAIKSLADLHDFLENKQEYYQAYRDLLALYEEINNPADYFKTKFYLTEKQALELDELEKRMPELEALLAEAQELNLDRTVRYMLLRLKHLYENGPHEKYVKIIEELEKIPMGDHRLRNNTLLGFQRYAGRGDLLLREKKYEQAAQYYLKAREAVAPRHYTFHDAWLDIFALLRLADLEEIRGRHNQARVYLDSAYAISSASDFYDQTIITLKKQVKLAEADKRFAEALAYTRKINRQEAIMDSLSQGFDVQRYHLESIRQQLTADNEKQMLELQLKDNQLNFSIVIAILSLFLIVGLTIGLRRESKNRANLANQNILIQRQAEELKNLDTAKSRFFANVSHELRTPLTLMLGPLNSVLKNQNLDEKQTQLLSLANQNGKQLQQLINDILDLRKLEIDSLELRTLPTEIFTFFNRHLAQFESLAAENQIDYSFHVTVDEKIVAPLDKDKCKQVLNNLLSNAFKFTPKGGKITAEVSLVESQLNISVADSGSGIHPDDLPHVFDRYFQTKHPDKPVAGGTGIGLALCKEYASLFGGNFTVESTLNKGATFLFSFPIIIQPDAVEVTTDNTSLREAQFAVSPLLCSAQDSRKSNILIVEDNVDLKRYLKLILSDTYEVHIASNGQEAINYLQQAPACDLILSDIMMPIMDGYQMLEKLKADDRLGHIPVIMLTARADMRDKLKALRIGVDDYLLKPFDEEELKVRMANILANKEARKEAWPDNEDYGMPEQMLSGEDRSWLKTFEQFCKQNYSSDILNVPAMAAEFAMSESTLLRQVKKLTGLTPSQYINEIRLDKARQFLENNTYNSIAKVGYEVGFNNTTSFSRAFKKRFGKTPSFLIGC